MSAEIIKIFDDIKYRDLAINYRERYQKNLPYPHIVIDDFLPPEVASMLAKCYPSPDHSDENFKLHSNNNTYRYFMEDSRHFHINMNLFASAISSRSFLLFLETLTSIPNLISDPFFLGGGAMSSGNGGFLDVHVDFNWNQKLQAWRRCNALFYLTPHWSEQYGGNLELWSTDASNKVKEVEPKFNRLVVFTTTNNSYHGQPSKLSLPKGMSRNVFSAFYYSTEKSTSISEVPHYTRYISDDNVKSAEIASSPYAEKITNDYLSE
jgi:Rps23 Pro-64 3,4-dihydroxylase Tpa1-like proline 4-hydroxylase